MNPFAILSRYITKQLISNFLMVFFAILSIILMFEGIEALRKIAEHDDISLWFALQLAITRMSKTTEIVIPFVMMVAAMITFWRLSKNNEFVIIRSAGVSMFGFLWPLMIAVFIIGIINVTALNPITSKLYELHEVLDYRLDAHDPNAVLFSSKGLWIREGLDDGRVFLLQAKSLRQEDDAIWMREVSITELNNETHTSKNYEAYFAVLEDDTINLKDVKVMEGGRPVEFLSSYEYKTNINIQRIKENFVEPNAISFWQLPEAITFYEHAGFSAIRLRMRFFGLLISPFLLVGMMMVAAIFMLQNTMRGSHLLFRVVLGVVVGFLVYFSSQVVYAFGVNGYIPVWLAVSAPTLIILLTSSSMLVSADEV
jgi:lipopolysaccharide export system permease protein